MGWGIRQGDPLFIFLFILCVEALVHVFNKSEASVHIHGARAASSGPAIHHLFFADDNLLLCKENAAESEEVKRCLKIYRDVSGQVNNFQNYSIIFGKKSKRRSEETSKEYP